jgi:hypothetical protein
MTTKTAHNGMQRTRNWRVSYARLVAGGGSCVPLMPSVGWLRLDVEPRFLLVKDSFLSQPITATITCPSCGETLLYGDKQCRFCHLSIDERYADDSAATQALLTNASKSANIIRALRNLLYVVLALTLLGLFTRNPGTVTTALIISVLNIIAPIRWRRKYGGITPNDPDVMRAQKDMRLELYLWSGAILMAVIAWSVLWLNR